MMSFNKKLVAVVLLAGFMGQVVAMDNKNLGFFSPSQKSEKRPRPEGSILVPAAPKKQKTEHKLRNVSSFKGRLDRCGFQDKILSATASGSAAEIEKSLSGAQALDIDSRVLENIFSKNESLTELQRIELYTQLKHLGVNLNGFMTLTDMNILQLAADCNQDELVKHIADSGFDVNSTAGAEKHGWTAAHFTTNTKVLDVLKRANANLEIEGADGNRPVDLIEDDTFNDEKLKVWFATSGIYPKYLTPKETETLTKQTRHAVAHTMGKPLHTWLHDRQTGRDRRSFQAVPFKYYGLDDENTGTESSDAVMVADTGSSCENE